MSKKKIIKIIIAVLFVVVVAGLLWYNFGYKNSSSTSSETTTNQTSTKNVADYIGGNSSLSNFSRLITAAGITATLQTTGVNINYVVLAPNNNAFKALPSGYFDSLLTAAKLTSAQDIVNYHIANATTNQLTDGQKLKTVEGQEVIVGYKNSQYTFTDAKGDVATATKSQKVANGTIYIIDTVLLTQ